jgi:hypothetical protein
MKNPFNLALLERARDAVNADRGVARLGSCDVKLGIKSDAAAYLVDFVAFECAAVTEVDADALRDADIVIEQDGAAWQRYLKGRRDGSAPTLVSLDVDTIGGVVKGQDPLKALAFERYHLTLQAFFDTAARLAAAPAAARRAPHRNASV